MFMVTPLGVTDALILDRSAGQGKQQIKLNPVFLPRCEMERFIASTVICFVTFLQVLIAR
jgi:hypothetical protein